MMTAMNTVIINPVLRPKEQWGTPPVPRHVFTCQVHLSYSFQLAFGLEVSTHVAWAQLCMTQSYLPENIAFIDILGWDFQACSRASAPRAGGFDAYKSSGNVSFWDALHSLLLQL